MTLDKDSAYSVKVPLDQREARMDGASPRLTALVQIRRASGLTQSQVAGQLGISKATYSAWETGRAMLSAERIVALAELFKCTPNDILGYSDSGEGFSTLAKDEEEFLLLLRRLPPNIKDDVLDIMRTTAKGWRLR